MKKYFITGGVGFIGCHLSRYLLERGNSVVVFDNLIRSEESRITKLLNYDNFKLVKGNIKNYEELEPHLKNIDCVYHLAAINGTANFYKIPLEILEVGIFGAVNILKASDKYNVQDIIMASSAEVYQNAQIIPTPEEVELIVPDGKNPRYSYGLSKIFTEVYSLNYKFKGRTRLKIFRPHNIYGPDMGYKHVIPEFIVNLSVLKNNTKFKPKGNLEATRAFCYIEDLIQGLKIIENQDLTHEIFHIGNDQEVSISDLLSIIIDQLNMDVSIQKDESSLHLGSAHRRCPDIKKIKNLGYVPKIDLVEGVSETINWYKTHLDSDNKLV